MSISRNFPALFEYGLMNLRRMYMYRLNMVFSLILTGVTIYLLNVVWRAAYADRTEMDGIALTSLLTYLTIANLQARFLTQEIDEDIRQRIREGQIAFDLNRPTSFPAMLSSGAVGDMLGFLPMLAIGLPIAFIVGEMNPPANTEAGIGYVLALGLAWIVAAQLSMVMGLLSFWTLELTGFQMIYRVVSNFATGALVPLWFMPDALRILLQALPFQAITFIPVSIYIGEPATGHIASALATQALWVVLLVFVIRWIWSRAFAQTVIQGG